LAFTTLLLVVNGNYPHTVIIGHRMGHISMIYFLIGFAVGWYILKYVFNVWLEKGGDDRQKDKQ
jgi:hypothetical protein